VPDLKIPGQLPLSGTEGRKEVRGYGDHMVCQRVAFSRAENTATPQDQRGASATESQVPRAPVMGLGVRHRVMPYESMLRGHALSRLVAAEARIAELETALREVGEHASHDPLTGAMNRRGINEVFAREAARARRSGQPLALALIDLDDFKAINDRHGHAVGDAALIHLTQVLAATLRPTDLCCRWGGEEFVVLMPGADRAAAKRALARVQKAIVVQPMSTPVTLAFSAGVVLSQNDESLEQMLLRADRAVYRAKSAGKRRIFSG
jgi:diguanylate cyclase (GGDEF)-like protein